MGDRSLGARRRARGRPNLARSVRAACDRALDATLRHIRYERLLLPKADIGAAIGPVRSEPSIAHPSSGGTAELSPIALVRAGIDLISYFLHVPERHPRNFVSGSD